MIKNKKMKKGEILNNLFFKKVQKFFKDNWCIVVVMIISLILHILALTELGWNYTLNSDDASYVNSGITFLKTGTITMHGVISAQIMPGMTFLIALFAKIFGTGSILWISLKIFWLIMGILTIYFLYKIIRIYTNKYLSAIPCLLFLTPDYIWMDNVILTETPFILSFILLIYYSLNVEKTHSKKNFILVVIFYIIGLFIRPNIGIYPLFLFIYLILKKYDFKLLIKQCFIAGIVLIITLTPWTIRNYKLFNEFIPLTYGVGNPLLLGTYQGYGFPSDDELNYIENVDKKMDKKMTYYLNNPSEEPYLTKYYALQRDEIMAKYRMHEWWIKDKTSMIKSYLYYKPFILINNNFYWKILFNFKDETITKIRTIELNIFVISVIIILLSKKYRKELLFLMIVYISQIALYSYTFAFSRYAVTLFFIRYVIIGIALGIIAKSISNRKLLITNELMIFENKFSAKNKDKEGILIIIPAYNEELNIENTVNKIINYSKKRKNNIDYIVINDGSNDNTKKICEENGYNHINLIHNLGIGGAVQTGYKYANNYGYDIAIQFDGDGQHDEEYIDHLIKEIENGYDFVIGSRFVSELSKFKSTGIRRIGIKILSNTIWICTGKRIYDPTSGFRAANKKVIKLFAENYPVEYPEPESTTTLIRKKYVIKEIPVKMHERQFGTSSINPIKSIYYMFSVIISIIITSISGEDK